MLILLMTVFGVMALATTVKNTEITMYNPYRHDVKLEIKCNWDNKFRHFTYYKTIFVRGKKSAIIEVPNHLRKCQVWPHIKFF